MKPKESTAQMVSPRPLSGRGELFHPTDVARAFHVTRLAVSVAIAVSGAVLTVVWEWRAGLIVVTVASLVAVDAMARYRGGSSTQLAWLHFADVTSVGVGMLLSGLPDAVVVGPYGYMLTAAVLILPRKKGLLGAAYIAVWAAAIIAFDPALIEADLNLTQERVLIALAIAIYFGATLLLTSVAAVAVRERHSLEESLQTSRMQLRTVVDGAPVVLFAVDLDGVFTLSEGAALAPLGLEPGEVVGRSIYDVYGDAPHVIRLVERALAEGAIEEVVDLGVAWFDVRMSPQRDSLGGVVGSIGIATDVTQQVRTKSELERRMEAEQLVAAVSAELIGLSPEDDAVGVVRAIGMVADFVGCDRAYLIAPETAGAELIRHSWNRPGSESATGTELRRLPWIEGQLMNRSSIEIQRIDDLPDSAVAERALYLDEHLGSLLVVPLVSDRVLGGYLALATVRRWRAWSEDDIHLFRTVAEMLGNALVQQRFRDRLEQLVASKDQFVASVSHELRTPLASVVGLSSELRDRLQDFEADEVADFHRLLAEEAEELSAIVEDLLVVARADIDQVAITPEAVSLRDELHVVASLLGLDESRIGVSGASPSALCDRGRFRQIVRNLMTNAGRYGGPTIEVALSSEGPWCVIEVRDDGGGVPAGNEERIFEAYEHGGALPGLPGSIGLGLTVARKLARLMGGDLTYTRRDGWSVFTLLLPGAAPHSPGSPRGEGEIPVSSLPFLGAWSSGSGGDDVRSESP